MLRLALALAFALLAAPSLATDYFVWSGTAGSGCTLGQCWENAYTEVARDWSTFSPTADTIYVHSGHAGSTTGTATLTGPSWEGLPLPILCVAGNTTGTTPGALCATSSASDVATQLYEITGSLYIWGVDIGPGLNWNVEFKSNFMITMENLDIIGNGVGAILMNGPAAQNLYWKNVNMTSDAAGWGLHLDAFGGIFTWEGGAVTGTTLTLLFQSARDQKAARVTLRGVDLSAVTQIVDGDDWDFNSQLLLDGCELIAGFVDEDDMASLPLQFRIGTSITSYTSEPGTPANPSVQFYYETSQGIIQSDTSRTMSGGASDGTTTFSWSLDTTANTLIAEIYDLMVGPPISFWVTAGATTARFHFADTAVRQTDEVGMRCLIPNQTDDATLKEWITTRPDPLESPANHPEDDAKTWGGTDTTTDFYVDVAATPIQDGLWSCYPWIAVDNERVSLNPAPDIQ